MSLGPFDLPGGPFLMLYGALLVATIIAGVAIPRWLRPEGRRNLITDPDQLAYLAGGSTRFGDALVARLLSVGALAMRGPDRFAVAGASAAPSAAERSVLALSQPIGWRQIERSLKPHFEPIERKLVAAGLLMSAEERGSIRLWAIMPYILLVAFGAIKWEIGHLRDKPTGFLTILLIVTFVLALARFFSVDRRTRAGVHALDNAKLQSQRLKAAPTTPEIGMAVALFGTAVLAGSAWSDFHRMRSSDNSGGDSSGSGSDGGSGCGGGGCGGCGG